MLLMAGTKLGKTPSLAPAIAALVLAIGHPEYPPRQGGTTPRPIDRKSMIAMWQVDAIYRINSLENRR